MEKEEAKKLVESSLSNMGCVDIYFSDLKDDQITVVFNCREITSFVTTIPGWSYSGIHLDSSGKHQYEIDFKKL